MLIKKYENRRLYDTGSSRYVNLEDVARYVRDGVDVKVVDARTERDLTREVLLQVALAGHGELLDAAVLRAAIRADRDGNGWSTVRDQARAYLDRVAAGVQQAAVWLDEGLEGDQLRARLERLLWPR